MQTNEHGQALGPEVLDWESRAWPEPVALDGRYVTVEPLTSARYADLFATTCGTDDDALWTYRPIARPSSLPTLWMHLAAQIDNPAAVPFALVPKEGESAGVAAGLSSYLRIDPTHGSIEVGGVLFGKGLKRTRAASEAIHLLMRHAFDDLGYRRFEWKCDSLNAPSRRAALRLGFVEEGRFRNHMVIQGRSRDTDWFSVTDAEWPDVRSAHERWLDAANFDESGQQLSSLSV